MARLPSLPPPSPLPSPPYSSDEEEPNPASSNDRSAHSSGDDGSSSPYECDWGNFLGRGPPPKNAIRPASSGGTNTETHEEESSNLEEDDGKSVIREGSNSDDNTIEEEVDARVFSDKEAVESFDYKHMENPSSEEVALDIASGTKNDPIYIFSDPEEDKSSPSSPSHSSSSLSNDFPKPKKHRLG